MAIDNVLERYRLNFGKLAQIKAIQKTFYKT